MKMFSITDRLWGSKAKLSYLIGATGLLLFTFLGSREIWTQEHRWADIVAGMFYRHDFLHPYLANTAYYDKPLLSYWLIAIFAQMAQVLNTWTLRLPSACAGLLAVFSIYQLGTKLKDKQFGLLAGWLLLTTYYFVFWSRTSSADMLNMAGSLFAVAWYFARRDHASFLDYLVFFIVLALTSLCKGLGGAIVPLIAVCIDIFLHQSWKKHLRPLFLLAFVLGLLVYFLPFIASSYFGTAFAENGLYLVYRENFLRYFKPFDHQSPFYIYFIYLPAYLLPWLVFFVPALIALPSRWKTMTLNAKWIVLTTLVLFLFFTLSGSRRSYYILPVVPFAILLTADWLLDNTVTLARKQAWIARIVVFSFVLFYVFLDLLPAWYYTKFGVNEFVVGLKKEAGKIRPWKEWNVVTLDAESKMRFYLGMPPDALNYHIKGDVRYNLLTSEQLLRECPLLHDTSGNIIFVTRKMYEPMLKKILTDYRVYEKPNPVPFYLDKTEEKNEPVAFVPKARYDNVLDGNSDIKRKSV